MVVDLTLGVITQLLFVMAGLALLVARSSAPTVLAVAWSVLAGLGVMMVAVAIFLRLQHRGMFEVSTRIAGGLLRSKRLAEMTDRAASVDSAVVDVYRDRPRLWRSAALRLAGWMTGTGEIWLVLYFFGHRFPGPMPSSWKASAPACVPLPSWCRARSASWREASLFSARSSACRPRPP